MRDKQLFVMVEPESIQNSGRYRMNWEILKACIEFCGGEVITLEASFNYDIGESPKDKEQKDSCKEVFVRDPLFIIPEKHVAFAPEASSLPDQIRLLGILTKLPEHKYIIEQVPAFFEGGNLLYSPKHNIIFQGREIPETSEDKCEIGTEESRSLLERHSGISVIPVEISPKHIDKVYHLDLMMSILPNGEALVIKDFLTKKSLENVKKIFGADNVIEIPFTNGVANPANLISVGNNLVMPSCSDALYINLRDKGYNVITPKSVTIDNILSKFVISRLQQKGYDMQNTSELLSRTSFQIEDGAVRCLVQEITPNTSLTNTSTPPQTNKPQQTPEKGL